MNCDCGRGHTVTAGFRHARDTIADAAEASGESEEHLLARAVADDRRHEVLVRALGIGQDTALRNERRALGRALAAGIAGDNALIDDEWLFIRAVADLVGASHPPTCINE
jgi:hypothetical protein